MNEPRATLLIRTGIDVAKVIRMPDGARLVIELEPHGLKVESVDQGVVVEDFADPGSVPGHDTVPMLMRQESFSDRQSSAEAEAHRLSTVHDVLNVAAEVEGGDRCVIAGVTG